MIGKTIFLYVDIPNNQRIYLVPVTTLKTCILFNVKKTILAFTSKHYPL